MLDPKKNEHGIHMTIKCPHRPKKISVFQSLGSENDFEMRTYCPKCFIKECFNITKQEDL
jgi:hypothetical protein